MKKLLSVLLITALVLTSFAACGSDNADSAGSGDKVTASQAQDGGEKADSSKKDKKETKDQKEKKNKKDKKSNDEAKKTNEKKASDASQNSKAGQKKSGKENNSQKKDSKQKSSAKYCTITVTCHTLVSKKDDLDSGVAAQVPSSGVILSKRQVKIQSGDTVFDITKRTVRGAGIALSYQGGSSTAYVDGINNIYEKDAGSKSGWLYKVNGSRPGASCGARAVKSGDAIQWAFTCNMGNDI